MNWLLLNSLIIGVCVIVIVTSAPSQNVKTEKRDVKSSEIEDIFSDDIKRKRSQEVIMFGNQQNKPAGMVDAALVGFSEKKSDQTQMENEDDEENDDTTDDSSDGATQNNATDMKNSKGTDITEFKNDAQTSEELVSNENEGPDRDEEQESETYLPRNFHGNFQYDELDDGNQELSEKINNFNDLTAEDWLEYGSNQRKRRNAVRNKRNFRSRSILTPLDKLMNLRHGARWKRDSKIRDDDVLGLLGILAAAEAAKERQEQRKHSLDELESLYAESFAEPEYSRYEEPSDLSDFLDKYAYYPSRFNGARDNDGNEDDTPDFTVYEPEIAINRRSSSFFPPADYRSLGIIGSKKRSMKFSRHTPGWWGGIESRHRPMLREPEVLDLDDVIGINVDERDGGSDDDEEDDQDLGRDEDKLYSLGELLNGHDVDDSRFSVYRRMI